LRTGDSPAAALSAPRQIFLVIAGFGADAEMIGYTVPRLKKRIGWIAYVLGGVRTLLGRSVDVVVQLPDESQHAHKARTVLLRTGASPAAALSAPRQIFLVIAGFGADAEMIGYTVPRLKKRIGWIAYVLGGVRTLLGRSVDVVVQLPDESQHAHKARTVLLGN